METESLEARVLRLERQNWLLRVCAVGAIAAFGLVLMGSGPRQVPARPGQVEAAPQTVRADTIEAGRFLLRAPDGRLLGKFDASGPGGNAIIELYDAQGRPVWSTGFRVEATR